MNLKLGLNLPTFLIALLFALALKAAGNYYSDSNIAGFAVYDQLDSTCKGYFGDSICDDSQADCGSTYKSYSRASCDECQTYSPSGQRGFNNCAAGGSGQTTTASSPLTIATTPVPSSAQPPCNTFSTQNCPSSYCKPAGSGCVNKTCSDYSASSCPASKCQVSVSPSNGQQYCASKPVATSGQSNLPAIQCTDSDGGMNLYTKGDTKGISSDGYYVEVVDQCSEDGERVIESICDSNGKVSTYYYPTCPNGCENGVCKPAATSTDSYGETELFFSLPQKQEILNMLSNTRNINPYLNPYGMQGSMVGPFLADGKTPNQYCKENGYGNCILVFNDFDEVYFNSDDLSCSGGMNYVNRHNRLNSPADCDTLFSEVFYSVNADPRTKSATCLGGGYGGSDHWSSYSVNFICVSP